MKNFGTAIDGTGTMSVPGRTNYLHNVLLGESLIEFDKLSSQVNGTTNDHLNFIKEGLLVFYQSPFQ